MKKLLSVVLSTTVLFAACGENKSEEQDKGASKVASENTTEKKVQKDDNKQTQQDTTKDKQKTEKQTTEDQSNQQTTKRKYTYVDALGHVDILSDAFIKGYTRSNRTTGFAGIEQGMDLAQVEQLYGKPTHDGKSRISENHQRYGDIAVENMDGKVFQIYINSSQPVSKEEVIAKYGKPTTTLTSESEGITTIIYNNDHSNGFQLLITFDNNDMFKSMEQLPETFDVASDFYYDGASNEIEDETSDGTSKEVTKEQLYEFMQEYGKPNEAEKSGTGIRTIDDNGDSWLIHSYNLSMAGLAYDYIINKQTGAITQVNPLLNEKNDAGSIYDYIEK
ncbi:hypothetical protein ACMGE6_02000 [Macrococcus equi]|uniref:hypothetical protein n=1 Tax=Macrococcus equi TaxID=3395462 RepID=UPI0039BE39D3